MYNRDYLSNNKDTSYSDKNEAYTSSQKQQSAPADMMAFLRTTYQLFTGSLLAATAGAYIGIGMVSAISSWYWGLVILEFALLFGLGLNLLWDSLWDLL